MSDYIGKQDAEILVKHLRCIKSTSLFGLDFVFNLHDDDSVFNGYVSMPYTLVTELANILQPSDRKYHYHYHARIRFINGSEPDWIEGMARTTTRLEYGDGMIAMRESIINTFMKSERGRRYNRQFIDNAEVTSLSYLGCY